MNILFIHEVDWLKKVVFDIHELSEHLSLLGHQVYAIDYENEWQKKDILDFGNLNAKNLGKIKRTHEGKPVTLERPGFIKFPLLDRFSSFFTQHKLIDKIVKERNIDIIILYAVPTNGIQTLNIARKHEIPVIFRSIDILYMLVKNPLLKKITFLLEKRVYKNADKIMVLTPKLSNYVTNMGAKEENIELLPFGVDTTFFNPNVSPKYVKEKFGIKEENKVILFMGTLFNFSGLDKYLDQFSEVIEQFPETKLLIVGGGYSLDKLRKIVVADDKLEDNVIFTGFQPYELMPQFINASNICVNPFYINDATRDIIPGKIYQYIACAKPVIATPLEGMKSMLPDENYGIVYSNLNDFGKNTIDLLNNEEKSIQIGKNGYSYCINNNSRDKIALMLEKSLSNLIEGFKPLKAK